MGALSGNYILKPESDEFYQLPELEDVTMHMAADVGLQVAEHTLIEMGDGHLAFLTKRLDRVGKRKIAQEDACQLSQLPTESKDRGSHEGLGKIIQKYSGFPGDDALRIFELTLFSFITGNADMHLKNFSLLKTESGRYRLSPAYDLVPTRLLLSEKEDPEELALHLTGKKSGFRRKDFHSYATYLGIPDKVTEKTISHFIKAREKMHRRLDMSFLNKTLIKSYKDLIDKRLKRLQIS